MKNILFILSHSPYESDLNYQLLRMALSVTMDANITIVYRDSAVLMASTNLKASGIKLDYASQERFLAEMEVPTYSMEDDMEMFGIAHGSLKAHIKPINNGELKRLVASSDTIFNV